MRSQLARGLLVFCTAVLSVRTIPAQQLPPAHTPRPLDNYLNLPLSFQNPSGDAETWVARGGGYSIGIEGAKTTIGVVSERGQRRRAISLEFAGALAVRAVPGSQLPGKVNYIHGNDPHKWKVGLATYGTLTLPSVYPGIDVVYYGNQRQLEFDFVVHPGADPGAIRMKMGGAGKLSIDPSGALNLGDDINPVRVALQQISQGVNGQKKNISGHFAIRGSDEVAFTVDSYDRTRPLIIDPTIVYSTFLGGGTSYSIGYGVALDSSGSIYVAGYTGAQDFPVLNAAQGGLNVGPDAFVTAINAAGTALIYSTYIGGSGYDILQGIAVDSSGAAWVTGNTNSTDFPLLNATQSAFGGGTDAVVAKFSSSGALQFSTYLGGSGSDYGYGIATDGSNAYVSGSNYGGGFPTSAGAFQTASQNNGYDAFVAKFSSAASLVYSTLLSGPASTAAQAVAADSAGNAYVTGYTYSSSFGATQLGSNSSGDAFVAKLNPAATSLVYGTLFGGSGFDEGQAIAVDSANNAYIAGYTSSTNLPVGTSAPQGSPGGGQDGFVAKLNAAGSAFTWATYLGGSRPDYLQGLAIDGSQNVYVTGYTESNNFPTTSALQPSFQGNGISLFQTVNGTSWSAFDGNVPAVVSDISVDPASSSTILVTTDQGIYYTSNNGQSWTAGGGAQDFLARSPASPTTIYAGSYDIYVSTDDGLTFNYTGNINATQGIQGLIADPRTAATAYAFGFNGVYVTTNQGAAWTLSNTGLPANPQVQSMVASSDGSLYAAVYPSGIYKSTNQAASWTLVNTGLPSPLYPQPHSLSVSQVNPATLYYAGGTVYQTTNGGTSWAQLSGYVPDGASEAIENPSGATLYAASYTGTLYESPDGGATWTNSGSGLTSTSISEIAFDPSNSSRAFVVSPVSYNGFITEVNGAGTAFTYSTYLGDPNQTIAYGIAANAAGDAFVTGYTFGQNSFPITANALQPISSQYSAFVTRISGTTGSCAYTVLPSAPVLPGYGPSLNFSVVAPSGCTWTASTSQSWATITAGASGTGSGSVTVQFGPNSSGATRTAVVMIGGTSVTVTQADSSCPFTLGTSSFSLGAAGGAADTTLTTNAGCPWAVTNDYPFAISPATGPSGTGSGPINLTVASNGGLSPRTFYLQAGTSQISISQAGSCTFTLTPASASPAAAGGAASFTVAPSSSNCTWSVLGDSPWLTVTSGGSGMGNGTVNYNVAGNAGAARTGNLTIGFTQFTVTQAAGSGGNSSTTALTSSTNPSTYGQNINLTATVSPSTATGTVTFKDGSTTLGTGTLSGGAATFLISTLTAGMHSLTAVYVGDVNDIGSTSAVLTQTVDKAAPAVTLISSANPSTVGQSITLIVTLSPSTATGTVTFMDGTATLGMGTLSGGTATLAVSTLTAGPHSLTANYGGDSNDSAAVSPALSQVVDQPSTSTTTTLVSSLSPSSYGQNVTFTATVTPSSATGNVTFYDGTAVLETKALVNGQATLTTRLLSTGAHPLRAYFAFGATYEASTSATLAQIVGATPALSSNFQSAVNYTAGATVTSVALGDFNGDGKPDLAVTNFNSNNVSVLLGNGDGTFRTAVNNITSAQPYSVVVGDFNGDGKSDLAVASAGNAFVSILLGNGDGTFQAEMNYASGGAVLGPQSIAIGDFNADGKTDLAVANLSQGTVSVLLGNGDGTFQAPLGYGAGGGPSSVAVGDFNGDGKADLAVANFGSNNVSVLLGNGDGTFQPAVNFAAGAGAFGLVVSDFNGDGKADLAVANENAGTASVLLGNGDGTFQAAANYSFSGLVYSLAAGDVDGDGKPDLVVGVSGNAAVLLGKGDGTFQNTVNYAVSGLSISTVIADFNGDGRADLAVGDDNSGNVSVLLASGSSTTTLTTSLNPSNYGQSVTLTATVSPSAATGTVTFSDGSTTLGTDALSGGIATFGTFTLSAGMHSLTASYGGDTNNTASTSAILTQTVNPPAPAISSLSPSSTSAGGPTFTLTVNGSNFISASVVQWNTTALTTNFVSAAQLTALVPAPLIASAGSVNVTVVNPGPSMSAAATFAVVPARTVTTLTSSANPSTFGQSINLTATVSPSTATGTVTFMDGSTVLGTGTPSGGIAVFSTSTLTDGMHSITAAYSGDANDMAGISPILTQTVNPPAPVISSLSPSSASAGGPAFTLTVNGSTFVAASTVQWNSSALTTTFVSAAQLTASVPASLIASAGSVNITVVNPGPSTSAAATFPVTQASHTTTTTTLTSSANPSTFGQVVTLTATIAPAAATGNATFYEGTTVLGIGALVSGVAQLNTSLLPSGAGSLRAYYGGDANDAPSVSAAVANTVNANPSGTLTQPDSGPFATESGPDFVAVGDFNGDGIQDLAVANFSSNTVTVLLGNGVGAFSEATGSPFSVAASPQSIAVGDFNGDGVEDLAVAGNGSPYLTVLLGNGSGGFSPGPQSSFGLSGTAYSVAVGDFNGDGIEDLAIANNGVVAVLLGNGSGGFSAASGSPFAAGSGLLHVAVGDFNGDGNPDLAITNFGGGDVTLLLGNGSGGFTPGSAFQVGTSPASLVVGDFNGDGKPDLAIVNQDSSNITVVLGNGLGGFTPVAGSPFALGTNPRSVAVGDFNGDGIQDLAIANLTGNNVTVLTGDGSGGFSGAGNPFATGTSPVVGDFNGDGRADLAVVNTSANNVNILLGRSADTSSVLSTTSPATVTPGTAVPLTLMVSDRLTTVFNAPTGTATFYDGTNVLGTATQTASPYTFTATGLAAGSHTLTATYSGDARSLASSGSGITITVVASSPVTIISPALPSGTPGQSYSPIQLTASGGTSSYTWSIVSQSQGLSLQLSSSGVLTGSYPNTTGSYTITVGVRDTNGSTATQAYLFFVNYASLTLAGGAPSGMAGQPYSFSPAASGGSGSFSWSASGVPGLQIDPHSGTVTGTPTTPGTFTLSVTVTDATANQTATATYSVTIAPTGLAITTTTLPNGAAGVAYPSVTLTAKGGFGTYTWSATGAPPGVTVSSSGVVGGTPASGGTFNSFTVTATDTTSKQTTSQTYSISIAFGPLSISGSGSLGGFVPGASVSASFNASGGKPPYTWSLSAPPSGFTVNGTGALAGTAPQAGAYSFGLTVTDSQSPASGASLTVSFSVLGFTTASPLPAGTTTASYAANILATGGTPPYTFSASGAPAGLSLASSGFLSGTPAAAGSFSLAVTVTDSKGLSVSGTFALTISSTAQPVQVSGASLPDGTVTTSYSQTLEADGGKQPYSWSVIGGSLPAGLALSGAGTVSGTPTATGLSTFTARATDTAGGFASAAFTVMVDPVLLQITAASLPNGIATSDYPPQIIGATGGMPPYSFALTAGALPSPMTFSNGQVSGIPAAAGSSGFTITATDSAGKAASGSFSIVVDPFHADLILSQGSVAFAVTTNGTVLPASDNVTVHSNVTTQLLNYSVAPATPAPWLSVTGGGTTPGAIGVALTSQALSQAAGNYQASVTVTCIAPSPCAGSAQTIAVSLVVTSPAPQLTLGSGLLSFSATTANPQPVSQPLTLQNTGGGTITIDSVSDPDPWVSISGVPATLPSGASVPVTVTVNPASLSAAYYQSTITVTSSAGSATVPLTLLLATNPTMTLNPAGTQFLAVAGNPPGNTGNSFLVSVAGNTTVNWAASVLPGAGWLILNTTSGSSTAASPGTVNFSIGPAAVAALASGAYYGTIQVTSGDVIDSPLVYQVVLNVAPAASAVRPVPDPQGLIFISAGTTAPPPQNQTVRPFASSTTGVSYQASSDSPWLLVSPSTGTTSSGSPGQSSVSVNTAGLKPGVYRGGVSYSFSSAAVRTVNVTLIVKAAAPAPAPSDRAAISAAAASCTPSQIVPTQTDLTTNFAQPASWPVSLTIILLDDCGNAVPNGQVIATFTNGDPPLILQGVDTTTGTYNGTWTPHASAPQVSIAARATAPRFAPATLTINGQVTPNVAPVLSPNGTVNIFLPTAGSPLAPGLIVQIYGLNLAAQATPSSTVPLTTSLGNTSVLIGGVQAPLYYVSPNQINAQVPFQLIPGKPYQVLIDANGALSTPSGIQIGPDSPGIAAFASGQVISQHADGSLVTDANPAAPGEYVVFYVAGMGLTTQTVGSGQPSPSSPLATTLDQPTLTLNGQNVPIYFSGLTPTFVGLYQVNFQVPANAPNGDLQLVLTQSGGQSNQTILAVHN